MSFLTPLFLLGGLALSLPLWLHLLQRENPIRLPFSSLMFFEKRTQSSMRERRLRYLLLLALRLTLLALLALAFAKPIWERTAGASLAGLPRMHIIALDTSLSMNYGDRWQRAVTAANAVVDGLGAADRAQVITMGPSVRVITQPISEREQLKAAIAALAPTPSRNSYGDLAEAVRNLAPEGGLPVTLHVISDFQQSAMPGRFSDVALPSMVTLEAVNLSEASEPNWAIESVQGALRIHADRKPRIDVTVAGFGTEKATKRVSLTIEGRAIASQPIEVPAAGRATVTFDNFEIPRGHSRAEVSLEPGDDLALDDKRLVAFENADPETILFVSNDPRKRDLLYYRAALDASSQALFQVQSAGATDVDRFSPDRFALVVLSDVPQLPSTFLNRLESYVQSGGSVLLAVGAKVSLAGKAALFPGGIEEVRYAPREGQRFQVAGAVEQSHTVLQQVERFRGVKFFRYVRLAADDGDVLARLSDGSPLLAEQHVGDGRVLILASSLDNVWNDLPVHPLFVPFVVESARYLSGAEQQSRLAVIDSVLELRQRQTASSMVQVFDPQGERVLSLSEAMSHDDIRLSEVGFYEVRRTGETELVAVNPDPRESNLRIVDPETLALWEATGAAEDQATAAAVGDDAVKPPPIRIWWFLLLLLVLVALVESIVGNWHLKVQREV